MERLKEAISKAKAQAEQKGALAPDLAPPGSGEGRKPVIPDLAGGGGQGWSLPAVQLDPAHLERNRIVAWTRKDPSHIAFNLLRTKVYQAMTENGWTTLAVTSPSPGCGKTMVATNLAISLARQADCRTVLVDLDLKKSSVARTLGVRPKRSLSDYLHGEADLGDCFVNLHSNLSVGLNIQAVENSAELMVDDVVRRIIPTVAAALRPKVIVFDLPPMLASDDAIAFLPQVDCGIIVAAAGTTTSKEIVESEEQLASVTNFLGVIVNKCAEQTETYYQGEAT